MRTVLITGANKSIGLETARQLAKQGYFIYLGSRNLANGQAAADKLKEEGLTNVQAIQIDISNKASIESAKDIVTKRTGSLDVLINNAGISGGFPQSALTMSTDDMRKVYDTNVFGSIDVIQSFIELLRSHPRHI
jgi:NAD(P)-dependent dehydrogenase (short-subunit alcohol dehydrogenase family)